MEFLINLIYNIINYIILPYRTNNVGQNYSSDKIFVTSGKFRHFCPTKNFVRRIILSFLKISKQMLNHSDTLVFIFPTNPTPRENLQKNNLKNTTTMQHMIEIIFFHFSSE